MAVFPNFGPLRLEDRPVLHDLIWRSRPGISELTFSNLFIWRAPYRWQWSMDGDFLLLLGQKEGHPPFFLPPVGPGRRLDVARNALGWLKLERGVAGPRIERADAALAAELNGAADLQVSPQREHFDYLYRTSDLGNLKGSKYHAKRNHINRFLHDYGASHSFVPIGPENLSLCIDFQARWCEMKRCSEDMNLLDEWEAVRTGLAHFGTLGMKGAAILIEGKVEAFTFGELLNEETAVVHIEKANPGIPGLYAFLNQRFCRDYWSSVPFINREQDLGEEGLRKAKMSYQPIRLAKKFSIQQIS